MLRGSFLLFLLISGTSFLIFGCAKQGYPNGGPKDETAPQALATKPANESRNFVAQQFAITFDEYITVKDANNNVLISPPMKQKPDFTTKGKRLMVKINDTLLPNTTYLFQFKGAIADYTEGNLMPSFEYVFSTGESMDTMMLAGRVLGARDGKPWKETVTVMAYREGSGVESDTIATTQTPDYITRCDKEGVFAFHYIPAGRYRLVALEDKNRNLLLEAGEAAAWEPTPVEAMDSIDSNNVVLLRLSVPDKRVQRVVKAEFTGKGRATIVTVLPMEDPTLTGDSLEWRLNASRDTMSVWFRNMGCDSARLVLRDTALNDTLKMRYKAQKMGRRRRGASQQQAEVEPMVKALCGGTNAFYDDLRLAFNTPVVAVADSAVAEVMRMKDSSTVKYPIVIDSGGLGARIAASLRSGEEYTMRMREGLFTDIFGNRSDSLEVKLTPQDYGSLKLLLTNQTERPLVVEVLDSKDSVVTTRSIEGSGELHIDHLKSGSYRLRAVLDADGNGAWTTGDYWSGMMPEYIIYYEKTLLVRDKWELDERWTVSWSDKR